MNGDELLEPEPPLIHHAKMAVPKDIEEPLDLPWYEKIAIDKAILTPQATSKKLIITLPQYEKKQVAVLIRDPRDGTVFYTSDGKPFYNLQEEEVHTGYRAQEIRLPGQEIFNVDLNSSFLSEKDVAAIRSAIALYMDLQLQTLRGKDRIEDMHYIYGRIMAVVETAKSRDGRTAELSKTTITKGMTEQAIYQQFREDEKKNRWQALKR